MEAWADLSFKIIRPCVFPLFTFVLVLVLCSVEHALEFRFVASSLAIVFVSLNCVCLPTLNSCAGLSYISIFSQFDIRLAFVLYY